jgi:hypothetical protein
MKSQAIRKRDIVHCSESLVAPPLRTEAPPRSSEDADEDLQEHFSGSDFLKFAAIAGGIVGAVFWVLDYAFGFFVLANPRPPGDTPGLLGVLVGAILITVYLHKLNHRK